MLDSLEIFASLSAAEKNSLELFCQTRTLQPGEKLFNEGDLATAMYIVIHGSLKAYLERSTGDLYLGSIEAGDMAGEMALFDQDAPKRRVASLMAREEWATLLVILDAAIIEISRKHEDLYKKIMQLIDLRNQENTKKLGL